LKIEKGSIVEWRVISDEHDTFDEETSTMSYSANTRSHVIAFESPLLAHTESSFLRPTGENSFKVKFLEPGFYPYRCQIFPRLRGQVNVFDNVHQIL
jgi:plastocyanin